MPRPAGALRRRHRRVRRRRLRRPVAVFAGATGLQWLSLNGVLLSPKALPLLKAIPRHDHLELTGCGLLDEEVDDLIQRKPGLKVKRQ